MQVTAHMRKNGEASALEASAAAGLRSCMVQVSVSVHLATLGGIEGAGGDDWPAAIRRDRQLAGSWPAAQLECQLYGGEFGGMTVSIRPIVSGRTRQRERQQYTTQPTLRLGRSEAARGQFRSLKCQEVCGANARWHQRRIESLQVERANWRCRHRAALRITVKGATRQSRAGGPQRAWAVGRLKRRAALTRASGPVRT